MNLTAIRRKKFFSRLLWLLAVLFLLLLVDEAVGQHAEKSGLVAE